MAVRRVLVAPQSFKGSLDAVGVAVAIGEGLRRVWPDVVLDLLPLADGGEGTVRALVRATGGELRRTRVHDPLGRDVDAEWGLIDGGRTAVVEMAAASGLPLLSPAERDPRITSTRGTGELILEAATSGAERLVIGIGGSATNDGGAGMARALGYRFFDPTGRELPEGGAALIRLHRIEGQLDPRLVRLGIDVACDVRNPLLGETGASAVYGPQKGATPAIVAELDAALTRYAEVLEDFVGRPIRNIPGTGAAGGMGAALVGLLDARLRSGAEIVLEASGFADRARGADLIVTGEGRVDQQSAFGKLTEAVTTAARAAGRPVCAIAGATATGYEGLFDLGLDALELTVDRPMELEEAMARADELIAGAAERLARAIDVGRRLA